MIKQSVMESIRTNKVLKAKLQIALDKAAPTIQRYLDNNDIMLTTAAALTVIREELVLTDDQILETVNA